MKPIAYLIAAGALTVGLARAQAPLPEQHADTAMTAQQQAAEKRLKLAVTDHPGDADARARLAGLYLLSNRVDLAIEAYQDAITLKPEDPRLFLGLALAYLHAGHHSMARAMTEQALALDPQLDNAARLREYIERKQAAMRLHDQHAGLSESQAREALQAGTQHMPKEASK
jgi:cytochrome c-type biogenesis protein CcmH/NrfG